jgi:hypothetical protein
MLVTIRIESNGKVQVNQTEAKTAPTAPTQKFNFAKKNYMIPQNAKIVRKRITSVEAIDANGVTYIIN